MSEKILRVLSGIVLCIMREQHLRLVFCFLTYSVLECLFLCVNRLMLDALMDAGVRDVKMYMAGRKVMIYIYLSIYNLIVKINGDERSIQQYYSYTIKC